MAEHGVSRLSIVVHLPPSDSQGVSIYPLKWGAKRPLTRKAQPHGTTKCSTKNTRKTIVTSWITIMRIICIMGNCPVFTTYGCEILHPSWFFIPTVEVLGG